MSGNAERLRALNRFGLGARPGEARTLDDPRSWLTRQLTGSPPELAFASGVVPDDGAAGAALRALRAAQRSRDQEALREVRQRLVRAAALEATTALTQRVATDRPFVERLVAFWSNHLCVSVSAKLLVAPLAGRYEREAIRPHVLGRYEDMVLASARHPAMLLYLDNAQSIGPASQLNRRGGRRAVSRGLNENHARELLELHTVGVDAGYGQDDVVALARILTGWTVQGLGGPGERLVGRSERPAFRFVDAMHEPGDKAVLGVRYDERGEAEGKAVIRDLCRHPATARHVATKLVRHFVSDEPPPADVDRIAAVFRESGGDLREVAGSLVRLDSAWEAGNRKFRTPQDWLVAGLRALAVEDVTPPLVAALRELRHLLWAPPAPKGYGDIRSDWADPDSLMNRAELARTIAQRTAGRRIDPKGLLEVMELGAGSSLPALLTDGTVDAGDRIALALAGPEFQWR
jgi:uncharacterized protein (DUF1800 family)